MMEYTQVRLPHKHSKPDKKRCRVRGSQQLNALDFTIFFHLIMQNMLIPRAIIFGVFALGTATAHAQHPQPVQLTQPDASSLRLRFENPTRQPARLQVLNLTTDNLLLNETHREPAYGTRLKFDTLPAGRYTVLLRLGRDRYRYTVQVQARPQGNALTLLETTTHRVEPMLAVAGQ